FAGGRTRRNCREVSDAADVLHDSSEVSTAEEQMVKERTKGRPFAPSVHGCRTKIRNYGRIHSGRDDCSFAGLPCGYEFVSQETLGLALMIEGLSVAADKIYFHAKLPFGGEDRIGIQFAEGVIQAGQLAHAGARSVHGCQ